MSLREGLLGLLVERPMHGYDLRGEFEQLTGGLWPLNIGQIYSTLQRLERDGFVAPDGDRGDRGKLRYALTPAGHDELVHWIRTPDSDPHHVREEVFLKLLLALRIGEPARTILTAQRRVYLQRIRDLAAATETARAEGRDDLVLLLRGAALHAEADLRWVEECGTEIATRGKKGGA